MESLLVNEPLLERELRIGSISIRNALLLAPMEGYSDQPFRRICKRMGADLVYTEFTSSEGLVRLAGKTARKISLAEDERPAGVQIFGRDPDRMEAAARRVAEEQQPDIVDINFGCPARKVCGHGAGSQLMREPDLLVEIARRVVEAVELPVTAKIRLGWDWDNINVIEIGLRLQEAGIQALTVHGRTRNQKYEGEADLDWIARVKEALDIPVIGNGDVRTAEDAERMFRHTGADAVMIGRGAMHNPWIFREARAWIDHREVLPAPRLLDRVNLLLDHLALSIEHKGEERAVLEMRKMYSAYLKEYRGVRQLRSELVCILDAGEVRSRLLQLRDELEEQDE